MADVPILYRFIATGQDSVASAFKSILSTAQSTSRGVTAAVRETEKAARTARTGARGGATATGAEQAAKRSADVEIREARRAADAKIREEQRALRYVAGIRDRHFAEQQRTEERAAAARTKAQDRVNASRLRTITGVSKDAALFGVGLGASTLGIVGQAAREGVQLQDIATRLSIAARGAGEKGADATTLRREFESAAIANPGVKAADVAAGAAGFVAKTGELGAARRFAGTFATVSAASGASVEDISNAAADLFQKGDIKSVEDMRAALAALTFQGKAGAFEIKDAAAQFAKMSAAASRFGVAKGVEGVKVLGGLTQMARSATGSPEQAATAVEATFRQLIAESKQIKGLGVDVFEKGSRSKTRDVRDVLVETIAKSKGDLPKLQKIFGEEGIRGISPLISAFNQAKDKASGSDAEKVAAGVTAMREALAKAIDAPGDWSEIVKDAAASQKAASSQIDAAWESIKAAVAREAVPAILKLAPTITTLADNIGPAITVFVALTEAAKDVVDVLKMIGILKEKTMTPEERLTKAKADLAKYNQEVGSGISDTPEERSKRMALIAAVEAADKQAFTTVEPGKGQNAPLTRDEFVKRYVESADPGDLEDASKRDAIEAKARALAASLQRDPTDTLASNDWLQGLSGENEMQKRARQQYQGDVTAGAGGADDLKKAAAELTAAARALQDKGAGVGGSLVGDT